MFSETVRRYARGHAVGFLVLAELQFESGTMYLHNEAGIASSRGLDGEIEAIAWKGLQGLAAISGLGASSIGTSRQVTCSLDAEDSIIKQAFYFDDQRAIRGRACRFWGQFYDDDNVPLDPRFHIYTGIGDRLRMSKSGPSTRRVDLMLEDFLVRRRRSANRMVTHEDQQSRDPGSTGFIYVAQMVDKTLNLFDAR